MKKVFLMLTIAAFSVVSVMAQLRKVPAEVTNAFKEKYPSAQDVEWKDKLTSFHAIFTNEGLKTDAAFTKDGWQETEITKDFDQLPSGVKDGFSKSKYTDWEKGSVVEVLKNDASVQYRIFIQKGAVQKKFLYFNKEGRLLKESLTL